MDPETLSYDYFSPEPSGYGTPIDWYTDDLWALHKLMRLAHQARLVVAVEALEPLREGAAAQLAYALQDSDRKLAKRKEEES